ncbi:hypothetical protein BC829DRAFT_401605 [Chytridium lagenaria]|nr:hypothetical protein BC829DRAFT_401605 [Chytridium lagenaria]
MSVYNALLVSDTINQDILDTWSVIGKKKLNGKALWDSEGILYEKLRERRVLRELRNDKFGKPANTSFANTTAPAAEKPDVRAPSPAGNIASTVEVVRGDVAKLIKKVEQVDAAKPIKTFAAAARAGLPVIATTTSAPPIQGPVVLHISDAISKSKIANIPTAKKVGPEHPRKSYSRSRNHKAVREPSPRKTPQTLTEDGWTVVVKKSGRR